MIVALDSWVHETPQQQVQYLTDLFESQKANAYPNRIVVIHHPMYTSSKHKGDIALEMIKQWEALFLKYNVTAVFENHVHTYKQTYPIRNNKVVTKTSEKTDNSGVAFIYTKDRKKESGIMYFGDGSWGVTYWGAVLDSANPIFRQIGVVSHVYHVNCKSYASASFMELYALGYNSTSKAVSEIAKSRSRILTV